jgi:hypothetical protein
MAKRVRADGRGGGSNQILSLGSYPEAILRTYSPLTGFARLLREYVNGFQLPRDLVGGEVRWVCLLVGESWVDIKVP